MLAALLMIGLLPLAFAFDDFDSPEDEGGDIDEDWPGNAYGDQADQSRGDMLDDPDDPEDTGAPPPRSMEMYRVGSGAGEVSVGDFRPGTDAMVIDVTGETEDFAVDLSADGQGALLSLFEGQGDDPGLVVRFEGLAGVPVDDIAFEAVQDGETTRLAMSDLIADSVAQETGGEEAAAPGEDGDADSPGSGHDPAFFAASELAPVDPDATDPRGPAGDDTGLAPADPDGGEAAGSVGDDDGLDPVDPDEVALDPVDPEEEEAPGPADETDGTAPSDPDAEEEPGPDDPDPGLDPVDPDAPDEPGEATGDLAGLIAGQSDWSAGTSSALAAAGAVGAVSTTLGGGDDSLTAADDGVVGTGEGMLGFDQGTPVLTSGTPIHVVDGGEGDDTLIAGDGAAYLFGGAGADMLWGGEGALGAFGGSGEDTLSAGRGPALLDGGDGDDVLTGGAGDDVLFGGSHGATPAETDDDVLEGGAGDDTLRGGHGADTLSGGDGNDLIDHFGHVQSHEGGAGWRFDWQTDGAADVLSGGAGDDTLIFDGLDTVSGGPGIDLFWLNHDAAGAGGVAEITDFEPGADFLRISLNPEAGHGDAPALEVSPASNGMDAEVRVNGDLIAVLHGAADATAADVMVEVRADVFPGQAQGSGWRA